MISKECHRTCISLVQAIFCGTMKPSRTTANIVSCSWLFGLAMLSSTSLLAAADSEPTVLSITGNLIDKIATLDAQAAASQVIAAYYELLDEPRRSEAKQWQEQFTRRVPDYDVAFSAADTAELNNVLEDFAVIWAHIRTIHYQEFTPAARQQLRHAYEEIFPPLAPDPEE